MHNILNSVSLKLAAVTSFLTFLVLAVAAPSYALQDLVDSAVDTAAEVSTVNNNFRDLDAKKQNKELPLSAADIDDAITSLRAGQIIFNETAFEWCGSTKAASSTAWSKVSAPTTPCSN